MRAQNLTLLQLWNKYEHSGEYVTMTVGDRRRHPIITTRELRTLKRKLKEVEEFLDAERPASMYIKLQSHRISSTIFARNPNSDDK